MNGSEQQDEGESAELVQLRRALASVYKVERLLSRRGTVIVYQGAEINPPRPVALRIFPSELGLGPAAARFRELARVVVALNHPNITPIYRIGFMAGVPYFVAMKLVEGRYLDEVIASQGALQVPLILAVLRATAAALAFAHGRGAVHGALTSGSVLLDRSGNVLVAEFGVARAVEDVAPDASGKARLASPEEAAGAAAGPFGDQYAFGLLALEMLTGSAYMAEDPLSADPLAALRDARAARVALPEALVRVVQTALARNPAERFASAADLLAAIEAIPFSDADGREASVVLGRLARGEPVPKLRALSPPTPGARASGSVAAPPEARAARGAAAEAIVDVMPVGPAAESKPPEPPTVKVPAMPVEEPAPVPRPGRATPPRPVSSPAMRAIVEPAAEVEAVATPAIHRVRASSPAPARSAAAPAPKRRSRVVWVLVVLLVIAGVGAGMYWLGRRSAVSPTAQEPAAPGRIVTARPAGVAVAAERLKADSLRRDSTARTTAPPRAAASDTGLAPERTGVLLLSTEPATADIFVDGDSTDTKGFLNMGVTAGRRRVEIVAPSFETWDTTVTVRAGATVDLGRVSLMSQGAGRLRLRVSPPTAAIFVDGQQVGVGELDGVEVGGGERQLRISAPGYTTLDTAVTVTAGRTLNLRVISLRGN